MQHHNNYTSHNNVRNDDGKGETLQSTLTASSLNAVSTPTAAVFTVCSSLVHFLIYRPCILPFDILQVLHRLITKFDVFKTGITLEAVSVFNSVCKQEQQLGCRSQKVYKDLFIQHFNSRKHSDYSTMHWENPSVCLLCAE